MSSQNEIELIKIYKASQEKYIYFLMAAAGSGIGFAVVQTKIEKLATHHWLWGLALLLWSLSFLCGMQFLEHHNSATYQNANYLGFTRDLTKCSPEIRLEYKDKGYQAYKDRMKIHEESMAFYGSCQMYLLQAGALAFISWHIYRMYLL